MSTVPKEFDLAVVGAGIVGLACALAAARRGLKVVVIERDAYARGASVRNFGLVTVTGQDRDGVWLRARRSREVWQEVAAQQRCPDLRTSGLQAVLWSPHELRVESRVAIPALTDWLAREYEVTFRWETAVHAIDPPILDTSRGRVSAAATVVCPGDDLHTLFPERLAAAGVGRCILQMMRLASPGFALPGTVMSDLSLLRYGGFASLPEAGALRHRLESEQREYLRHGVHLIIAQGPDGSLVVGDSHHYEPSTDPVADEGAYALILDEYRAVTGQEPPAVRERWTGTYAVDKGRAVLIDAPSSGVRLVVVTSGIGASTGFAIGEEVINDLYN
jgi:FAD dependent oxidoreductase TIGR03364